MDAIGIRMTFLKNKWPELNKMTEAGQMMMWGLGVDQRHPDGDQFYSYLVSRNIGTSNDARLRLPEYDKLYDESHALPDGAPRNASIGKLNELIASYAPWILADYPYRNDLTQPWLKGFKANPFQRWQWAYYDADAARARKYQTRRRERLDTRQGAVTGWRKRSRSVGRFGRDDRPAADSASSGLPVRSDRPRAFVITLSGLGPPPRAGD